MHFPADLHYLALIFGLFVVPKFLQRFRVPSTITSLALGIGAGAADLFTHDATVSLLASLGISSLFLFAGLEVDIQELRRGSRILVVHVLLRAALLVLGAWCAAVAFGLDLRVAGIVALALLTPSTGFILDSLRSLGLSEEAQFWTKSKAIGSELLALAALFVLLQSTSALRLVTAMAVLLLLILAIPVVFRVFAERLAPYSPRSEFAFLLMLAVVCAYATRALGVYYLVGAFLVGVAAHRFREQVPGSTWTPGSSGSVRSGRGPCSS